MTKTSLQDLYEDPLTAIAVGAEAARYQAEVLAEMAAQRVGHAVILDVGCGDGAATNAVVDACKRRRLSATLIACDWALAAVTAAQSKGLAVVRSSAEAPGLAIASATVDIVLMSEIIEHVVDTDALLAEAHRVLVPGGILVCSTPNLAAWYNRVLLLGGVQPLFTEVSLRGIYGRPGTQVVGHLRLFTHRAFVQLLAANGFGDTRVTGLPYHDVPRGFKALDRLMCRLPSASSLMLATSVKR